MMITDLFKTCPKDQCILIVVLFVYLTFDIRFYFYIFSIFLLVLAVLLCALSFYYYNLAVIIIFYLSSSFRVIMT